MGRYDILLNKEIAPVAVKKKPLEYKSPASFTEFDMINLQDYDNRIGTFPKAPDHMLQLPPINNRIDHMHRVQEIAFSQTINEMEFTGMNMEIGRPDYPPMEHARENAKQNLLNEIAQSIEYETVRRPGNRTTVITAKIKLAVEV